MCEKTLNEIREDIHFLAFSLEATIEERKLDKFEKMALEHLKKNIEKLEDEREMLLHTRIIKSSPKATNKEVDKELLKAVKDDNKKEIGYIIALVVTVFSLLFYNFLERENDKEAIRILENELNSKPQILNPSPNPELEAKIAELSLKNSSLKTDLSSCKIDLETKNYMLKELVGIGEAR